MADVTPSLVPQFSCPERNRRVLLIKRPAGIPRASDFALDDVPLEPLHGDEFRVRNLFLSVDPAQRGWASAVANYSDPVPLNTPMRALAVGMITESRHDTYPAGTYVYGWFGWQDYATVGPAAIMTSIGLSPRAPLSAYAGILGINGLTASLGLRKLGRPASGETLLVSTAAGAVGSIVGQIGRGLGLKTIGLTGSDEKAAKLRERFGYDVAINYRQDDWAQRVTDAAPGGIDVYFDNVGGTILDRALRLMRHRGRIVQCGTASVSSWDPPATGLRNEREVLTRRLTWSGLIVFDYATDFATTIESLADGIASGALVYDEDIDVGLHSAPEALTRLYAGDNHGKKLIFVG